MNEKASICVGMYLKKTPGGHAATALPMFVHRAEGVSIRCFIVPPLEAPSCYAIDLGWRSNQRLTIGGRLTIDGRTGRAMRVAARGTILRMDMLENDYLAFAKNEVDDDASVSASELAAIGTIDVTIFACADGAMESAELESVAPVLSSEPRVLKEKIVEKQSAFCTVSGGVVAESNRPPYRRVKNIRLGVLHICYATADNFYLRDMLPAACMSYRARSRDFFTTCNRATITDWNRAQNTIDLTEEIISLNTPATPDVSVVPTDDEGKRPKKRKAEEEPASTDE